MTLLLSARALALAAVVTACTGAQPQATPTPTATPSPTPTEVRGPTPTIAAGVPGAIEGHLAYPSDFIPPLRVYAVDVAAPGRYRLVTTQKNQQVYLIANLPAGEYRVFATAIDGTADRFGAAYTKAVQCGLVAGCDDHTPAVVQVKAAAVTDKIDVTDWYAPSGTYPTIPTGREPFKAGDAVLIDNPYADSVNVRASDSLRGAIVATASNGEELRIAGGPTSNDGYDWYAVSRGQTSGYIAGFALRRK